jgi:uncharacterized repeat protein (TIGR02543 family)
MLESGLLVPYSFNQPVEGKTVAGFDNPVLKLYGNWNPPYVSHGVEYNINDGEGVAPEEKMAYVEGAKVVVKDGSHLTKDGMVFIGWKLGGEGTLLHKGSTFTMGKEAAKLIAQYAPSGNTVDITFMQNIDENDTVNEVWTATKSAKVTYPNGGDLGFVNPHHIFLGWAEDNAATEPSIVITSETPVIVKHTEDITLYAIWEALPTFTVTVNESFAPEEEKGAGTYYEGDEVTVNAGTRAGYDFAGWTVEGNTIVLSEEDRLNRTVVFTMPATNVVITANWENGADYTVTVNNSYADITGAGGYDEGDEVTINAGTRAGYSFTGWTVNEGGIEFESRLNALQTFEMPANNIVVTANWQTNGGGGTDPAPEPEPNPEPIIPDVPEPPVPTVPENTLVPTEEGNFVELTPEGTPLGTWNLNPDPEAEEDTWIFEPEETPLGAVEKVNPVTGARDMMNVVSITRNLSAIGLIVILAAMLLENKKRVR